MVAVAITHNAESIEAAVHQALSLLPLDDVVPGKLVAVKPNENGRPPRTPAGSRSRTRCAPLWVA
jgi:hypothetical protein